MCIRDSGTIVNWGSSSAETNITNSGTIRMRGVSVSQGNVNALCAICAAGSSGAVTITNSGTIETIGDDRPAIYSNDTTTTTITNSGTISGHGTSKDILIADDASGTATTTININRGATWNKGIDLGNTNSKIVLGADNNRDITVTIYNHDNLTIENKTGTNGFTLTTEDLDSGGSSNDGTLTILGENLEVEKNNQIFEKLKLNQFLIEKPINDTVYISLLIDNKGKISITDKNIPKSIIGNCHSGIHSVV